MIYRTLLMQPEWKTKRLEILRRDRYRCRCCGSPPTKEYPLHVHHKDYHRGKKPWEYDNNLLVTLCRRCHDRTHKEGCNQILLPVPSGPLLISALDKIRAQHLQNARLT